MLVGPAGSRAFEAAGREVCGADFSLEPLSAIARRGRLDPWLFRAAATACGYKVTDADHARFQQRFVEMLPGELAAPGREVRVLPGVMRLLGELRQRTDVSLGMVTGNYTDSARAKLRAGRIDPDWFAYSAFGQEAAERHELVELAIGRFTRVTGNHLDRRRVIVVGDTPHDVACARHTGCRSLAVTTGHFTADELRAAGAEVIVEDLSDGSALWAMVDD